MRDNKYVITRKKRKQIISELTKQYGYRCWYCGKRFQDDREICVDHIKPLSQRGANSIDNFALSCKMCNSHKFYFSVIRFLNYLAYIRTGSFECPIVEKFKTELEPRVIDILQKSFY